MFVAKVVNGTITDSGNLYTLYPTTSFPKNGPSDEWMTNNNIVAVKSYRPYDKATEKLLSSVLYVENGNVYDVIVGDLSDAEIAANTSAENERKAANVRKQRDALLAECDWTVLQDSPLTDAQVADWVIYRQALRDITDHANFPDLNSGDMDGNNSDWPTKPE